jgi:hypothetical protein
MKHTFVFSVSGDRHVAAVNKALRFLKNFTRNDIVVVTTRASVAPEHDQCISISTPPCFDDHQASIALKTSLHRIVGADNTLCGYLDSDVLAVSHCVDTIFDNWNGPITFAPDHTPLNQFSRYAVNCTCPDIRLTCDHLRDEIRRLFGVNVPDPEWRHWNGGVFLFNDESREFMDLWHDYTLVAFEDSAWKTRDQGTLVAATWSLGLQDHPTLPRAYNYIVDPFIDMLDDDRAVVDAEGLTVDNRYSLTGEPGKERPYLLHMINGGASRAGWKNFEDACRLLESAELWRLAQTIHERETTLRIGLAELTDHDAAHSLPLNEGRDPERSMAGSANAGGSVAASRYSEGRASRCPASGNMYALPGDMDSNFQLSTFNFQLSADNRVVHGMWIGKRLTKLELLTLHSFVAHGHDFHLWCYDDIKTPLPKGVTERDATEILPARTIYRRRDIDRETGVGKGSYGPFSDLFRYKLLYEKGGYWVDMDITCLRPLDFREEYVFRTHRVGVVGNLMKCPAGSPVMHDAYERTRASVNAESPWLLTNKILSECVEGRSLGQFMRPEISNPDAWKIVSQLVDRDIILPANLYAIHWLNEYWRTLAAGHKAPPVGGVPDKNNPPTNGTLASLYRKYGL